MFALIERAPVVLMREGEGNRGQCRERNVTPETRTLTVGKAMPDEGIHSEASSDRITDRVGGRRFLSSEEVAQPTLSLT